MHPAKRNETCGDGRGAGRLARADGHADPRSTSVRAEKDTVNVCDGWRNGAAGEHGE